MIFYLETMLYESHRNTITEDHGLGGLNNISVCSHFFEGSKSKVKVLARLVSGETSLPGVKMGIFSPCIPMAFPLCWLRRDRDGKKQSKRMRALLSLPLHIRTQVLLD